MGSIIRYEKLLITDMNQSRSLYSSTKIIELKMDESQVHQIIEANDGVLLKQSSDLISALLVSLKRPAKDSFLITREIKMKTADARPVFKKKSNKEQKATTKVRDTLKDAKYNLESNNLKAEKNAVS